MTTIVVFECCPKCGFSIFVKLADDVRRCVACFHEWKPAPAFVPSVFAIQTAAAKGGA